MVEVGQIKSLRGLILEARKENEVVLDGLTNGSVIKVTPIQDVQKEIIELYGESIKQDELDRVVLVSLKEFITSFTKKETKVTKDYIGGTRTVERFIENLGEYKEIDLKYHLKKLIQTKLEVDNDEGKSFKDILVEYQNGKTEVLNYLYYMNRSTYEIKYRINELATMKSTIHNLYQNYFPKQEIDENFYTYLMEFITQKTITPFVDEFTELTKPIYEDPNDFSDEQLRGILYKRILWAFESVTEKQHGKIDRPEFEITDEMLSEYVDDVEKIKQNPVELALVKSWIRKNNTGYDTRPRSFESSNREVSDEEGNKVEADYDNYVMNQYQTLSNQTDFEKFVTFFRLEDFLNQKQKIIYPYIVERESLRFKTQWMSDEGRSFEYQEKLTYKDIAALLLNEHNWNITPQGVKLYDTNIRKIIMEQYLLWKTKTSKKDVPSIQLIKEYLVACNEIELELKDRPHFVLFNHLMSFLKFHYYKGEQNLFPEEVMKRFDAREKIFDIVVDTSVA